MKQLAAVLFSFFVTTTVTAQTIRCKPSKPSHWDLAEVVQYYTGAQSYLHIVKATGTYLVADLICNQECVGFVNGLKVTGKIEFEGGQSGNVVAVSIDNIYSHGSPSTLFICE